MLHKYFFIVFCLFLISFNAQGQADYFKPGVLAEVNGKCIGFKNFETREMYEVRKHFHKFSKARMKEHILLQLGQKFPKYHFFPAQPTEEEIKKVYLKHGLVADGKLTDKKIRQKALAIASWSNNQKRINDLYNTAIKDGLVKDYFDPPGVFTINVPLSERKYEGPLDANIAIVEFLDFQCLVCNKARDMINKIRFKNPNVGFQVMHFPLVKHNQAYFSAMAAECARDQGHFDGYSSLLLKNPNKQFSKHLREYAKFLDFDQKLFETCLNETTYKDTVQFDLSVAASLQLNNTPVFVVGKIDRKNRLISGEVFVGLVTANTLQHAINKLSE